MIVSVLPFAGINIYYLQTQNKKRLLVFPVLASDRIFLFMCYGFCLKSQICPIQSVKSRPKTQASFGSLCSSWESGKYSTFLGFGIKKVWSDQMLSNTTFASFYIFLIFVSRSNFLAQSLTCLTQPVRDFLRFVSIFTVLCLLWDKCLSPSVSSYCLKNKEGTKQSCGEYTHISSISNMWENGEISVSTVDSPQFLILSIYWC